jgi:hypothetical protein
MITQDHGKARMELHAGCYWGELCDVGITQKWVGIQGGDQYCFMQLTADQAEALIVEMQAAINEARRIDAEYNAYAHEEAENAAKKTGDAAPDLCDYTGGAG